MTLPCFLDFEASSLGVNSYPIQVAWSRPEGDRRRTPGRRHDAGNDVRHMIELYRMALARSGKTPRS